MVAEGLVVVGLRPKFCYQGYCSPRAKFCNRIKLNKISDLKIKLRQYDPHVARCTLGASGDLHEAPMALWITTLV
jgi:hypothetical protein